MPDALATDGTYPSTGRWAVTARLSLVFATAAVCFASLAPTRYVPRLLYSYHLEHFAAFYVVALSAAAAFPQARLRKLGAVALVLAGVLEAFQFAMGHSFTDSYQDLLADVGGAFAALLPIAVDRFRRLFKPVRPPN